MVFLLLFVILYYYLLNKETAVAIYTYRCSQCDHEEDVLQKQDDDPIACKYCSPLVMDRLLGSPAIKLVGSGFHDTDYTRFGPKRKG